MQFKNNTLLRRWLAAGHRDALAHRDTFTFDDAKFSAVLKEVARQHPKDPVTEWEARAAYRILTSEPPKAASPVVPPATAVLPAPPELELPPVVIAWGIAMLAIAIYEAFT